LYIGKKIQITKNIEVKEVENMWEWLEELLRYWGGKG